MILTANADEIDITDLSFPPRVRNLGLWNIQSRVKGKVPIEISYLTSGLSWRAFYMGTLTEDEKSMHLQAYVRITNNSGEDYENAKTRLVVGKVHILDEIAELARRMYPYGRPGERPILLGMEDDRSRRAKSALRKVLVMDSVVTEAPKQITKEGLSEYFLYTIEGTETIPSGSSKRLLSFDIDNIPVVNLYKYEEEKYGSNVVRFVSFKNNKDHKLGQTPIPGGMLKVYHNIDKAGHLSYTGQSDFKYIPVDEDIELNLGNVRDIVVEPKLMDFRTDNYKKKKKGNISGWDEIRKFTIEVKNTREIPVKVQIKRNFHTPYWDLKKSGDFDNFEKVDKDTVKFELKLKAGSVKKSEYVLTTAHGTRAK